MAMSVRELLIGVRPNRAAEHNLYAECTEGLHYAPTQMRISCPDTPAPAQPTGEEEEDEMDMDKPPVDPDHRGVWIP